MLNQKELLWPQDLINQPSCSVLACWQCLALQSSATSPANADPFHFSTGNPDGLIGTASRPASAGKIETESADDFILNTSTVINQATFAGLLSGSSASISDIIVEIYRVFPNDSNTARTSGPPTFSTPEVPTRVNSPSDVGLDSRDLATGGLTFLATLQVNPTATVANSVVDGIHPMPNQTTGGEGPVTGGRGVSVDVTFTTPFTLPSDHYFFVPQVQVTGGEFLWFSAVRSLVAPGTPFAPDLQSCIRNTDLDPDWLRIGTDIVGPPPTGGAAPTFNAAFSLDGNTVPEPSTLLLLASGLAAASCVEKKKVLFG